MLNCTALNAQSPIAKAQTKPNKPKRSKIEVLDESELVVLLDHLRGHWLYMPVLIAAYTGLRRGEVVGCAGVTLISSRVRCKYPKRSR